VYQYDALRRLISAASTPNVGSTPAAWTQTFQYDGFGNLTAKVLNLTTTPIPVNAATNQLSSAYYDANGNMTSGAGATLTYDEVNRVKSATEVSGGTEYYSYAPNNKRIYRLKADGVTEEWTFYGAQGERLGVYSLGVSGGFTPLRTNVAFAGTLILDTNSAAFNDRTGSNRASGARFYPYGDEITSTANDREKFGTYLRDGFTGLDYADQRFYASTYGRFNTPDPYIAGGAPSGSVSNPNDPGSWNRYAYTRGDPINRIDPRGTDDCDPTDTVCWSDCDPASQFDCLTGYYCPPEYAACFTDSSGGGFSLTSLPGICSGWSPDTINPAWAMACLAAASAGVPPATVQSPVPSCTVEVGYLTNVFSVTTYTGVPASHSYIDLTIGGQSDYIEVSPTLIATMKVNITSTGIYQDSTFGQYFWSEQGPQACAAAAAIYRDAGSFPTNAVYGGLVSNSNSFVSTILGEAGVAAPPLVGGPPAAWGWGGPIVYYPILGRPGPRLPPVGRLPK
jgi:RHS repeat-associated protein